MLEWLKRHAWKACGLQKGLASSNLALSAKGFAELIVSEAFSITALLTALLTAASYGRESRDQVQKYGLKYKTLCILLIRSLSLSKCRID